MAKKAKTALAKRGAGTALSTFVERLRKDAVDAAAREILTAPRVSFKGGSIAVAGQDVPINAKRARYELPVIITDFTNEKAYYLRSFSEDDPQTPVCSAFGDDEKALTPLMINGVKPNTVAKLQSDACFNCPHNVFGTAENGDGKRCKDVRRLMVIAANVKAESLPKTEVLLASIPPTSLKNWKLYLKGLKDFGFPPWGVRTLIYTEKHKGAYVVKFEPCGPDFEPVSAIQDAAVDEDLYNALQAKKPSIREAIFQPYPIVNEGEEKPGKKAKGKAAKAKAKKRMSKVS